jgi:DNA topoisomerase-1
VALRSVTARNVASARAAGLRYVRPDEPGITRVRTGGSFSYHDAKGRAVRHARTLERIRGLVIPPAWTDVWICSDEDGHLQATGRDARGRKQYRYHHRWTSERDTGKYGRTIEFALALPAIRRRVSADLKKEPLSREFVLATVVRLLEKTLMRIGNKEYARANKSFGLTTLQDHHVRIHGGTMRFIFRAKSGVMQDIEVNDATLARIVSKCRGLPGRALFQYIGPAGKVQCVDSTDVNAYLKEITGQPFTAKNFRTWAGTVLAAAALCEFPAPASEAAFKRSVVQAVDFVSGKLGNTRAVCRKCYVHPAVLEAFRSGVTIQSAGIKASGPRRANFSAGETAVLALLRAKSRDRAKSRGQRAERKISKAA